MKIRQGVLRRRTTELAKKETRRQAKNGDASDGRRTGTRKKTPKSSWRPFKKTGGGSYAKKPRKPEFSRLKPEIDPILKGVFRKIGKPASAPFVPDPFQLEALEAIRKTDCLVTAPTGSGKTWIAEQAIRAVFNRGGRCWYASPLKALTNSKWVEFADHFAPENVGILTGDTKENTEAPIIVGTTEILRNQLYDVMHRGADLNCDLVILDEAHFLGDYDRGVVWEEVMIYLPVRVNLLLLSATVGNAGEIADWLSSIRGKNCIVVSEEKRPVPLYPLFLHPTGRIMPYLEKRSLSPGVARFLDQSNQRRHGRERPTPFGEIINALEQYHLLPAIFFLKSRSECDGALKTCRPAAAYPEADDFSKDMEDLHERFPYIKNHKQLHHLMSARVAAHHGGQLPAWKFLVETMMKKGHLRAIFATSTVSAGVNFPARTIVLMNSDIFNGHEFNPLSGTEFHQMTGRAGRRGQDNIGFMLIVPGRFMDLIHIKRSLFSRPDDTMSRIRNDFSMILNLLLSQTPEDIRQIFERSFAAYQRDHRSQEDNAIHASLRLWEDFCRHLDFLKQEGFVDPSDRLTGNGIWASKLRLDQPLLIAECLRREALPRDDEKLLAAVMAPFIYDGDQELLYRNPPRKLREATHKVAQKIKPLMDRMRRAGFNVNPLYLWTSAVIYDWARGFDWDAIIKEAGMADGDLAMLILRTADNLRQIMSLRDTHPEIAGLAAKARDAILREPVVFE
ncbi:MAG: DEAD/DEAH box helicase [Deltaproteobacteria bacterium]|nr:DEAD/DEAH box helicase [Deltaproteobacteria bacterium]